MGKAVLKFSRVHIRFSMALLLVVILGGVLRLYAIDRLPPGLNHDEAFNNLMALRLVQGTMSPPVYFRVEFGREPLHMYLIAFLFRLFGTTPLGGRIVSALAGTWLVLALGLTIRELFYVQLGRARATRLGLLSALLLAAFYWPMHYSRIGMEPILVPALAIPAFGLTWRALRTRRAWDAVLGGVFLGGTMYAYPASRFVPLLLAFFFSLWVLLKRGFLRENWRALVIVAGVALLVFAPLGYFFLTHPFWFIRRADMVNMETLPELKRELGNLARGFFQQGDINWRQNLANRPIFDSLQGFLFVTGVLACLALHTPAHLFLLAWMVIMLIPSAITEYAPHFGRMLTAAPAAATLMGAGVVTWYDLAMKAARRWRSKSRQIVSGAMKVLLGASMMISGYRAVYDHFVVWANSPELFIAFDIGLRWAGEQMAATPEEEHIYFSPVDRNHPTLTFLLNDQAERIHSFNGRRCYVYPQQADKPVNFVVLVHDTEDPYSLPKYQAAFPQGQITAQIFKETVPYAVVYRIPAGSVAQTGPTYPQVARFSSGVDLLGYDAPEGEFIPGSELRLRLYWQSQVPIDQIYKTFVHIWGTPTPMEGGRIWGQEDAQPCDNSYPYSYWMPGDILVEERHISIPPETPPGEYQIAVGMYIDDGPRFTILDETGAEVGDYVVLTTFHVKAP